MLLTNYRVELPQYLDDYIFQTMGATYRKSGPVFVSKGWDLNKTLEYLGTYFPRSYSESFCVFSDYLQIASQKWGMKEELCIFDLGCGTGGEIIGLIDAIRCKLPNVKRVEVWAVDGNPYAVESCRNVIEYYKAQVGQELTVDADILEGTFSNYEELETLSSYMGNAFDIVMSFKALNEVILTGTWGRRNPYRDFVNVFSSHLDESGVLCLVEVDTPVSLMECPDEKGGRACDMDMKGACRVKQMAEYLLTESNNKKASISGQCPLNNGGACVCMRDWPIDMGRACRLTLSYVFYRDLMYQAVFKWPLTTIYHNLDAHRGGGMAEKRFFVKHSRASIGDGDGEGLFWTISTVQLIQSIKDLRLNPL